MIVGKISDAKKYYSVNEIFPDAFEFLKTLGEGSVGSYDFEKFRVNVFRAEGFDVAKDGSARLFEAHREYLDIHYVISGSEGMGYADIDRLSVVDEYNAKDDYLTLSGEVNKLILNPGEFCITFPEDAHMPSMTGHGDGFIKAVVKIKL